MAKIRSYCISSGNSAVGTVGFVARVAARSPEEAIEILKRTVREAHEVPSDLMTRGLVEYCSVYFNFSNLTVEEDIEHEEETDVLLPQDHLLTLIERALSEEV